MQAGEGAGEYVARIGEVGVGELIAELQDVKNKWRDERNKNEALMVKHGKVEDAYKKEPLGL